MTISDLKLDTHFLASSTSATYYETDITRNINIAYSDTARLIWESAGEWQYDDSNVSTLPIATLPLVSGQQDYELPTTAQRIEGIDILDAGGNYNPIRQVARSSLTQAQLQTTTGFPTCYDILGRSVMLFPTPSSAYVTLAAGMRLHVNRDIQEFAVSATSGSPGFAKPFHRILSYAAALDFLRDDAQRRFLIEQKTRLENGLIRFYSKRDVDYPTNILPASKKNWKQYQ